VANRLKDKVAMIVGAGSSGPGWGNGKATAVAMAREGAKIFCVDANHAAAEETANIIMQEGGLALPFRADVTKDADVEAMVRACVADFGRIDGQTHAPQHRTERLAAKTSIVAVPRAI